MNSEELIRTLDKGSFKTAVVNINDHIYVARVIAESLLPKQPPTNEEVMGIARMLRSEAYNVKTDE